MKTKLQIIIALALIIAGILAYNAHKDAARSEYAAAHSCTWVVAGSHDICK